MGPLMENSNNIKYSPRSKPSFDVYASDLMASEEYALATLHERGLLLTLLNYCWVNGSIPADHSKMARLLQLDIADINNATNDLIQKHLVPSPQDATRLYSPELERQRMIINERRQQMSAGGRRGGQKTQERNRLSKGGFREPSSPAKAPEMKRNETNRNAVYKKESYPEHEQWIKDNEGTSSFEDHK